MVQCENGYNCYELRAVDDGIFRLRVGFLGEFHDTLLSRYKILHEQEKMKAEQIQKDGCVCLCAAGKTATLDPAAGTLCIAGGKKPLQISFSALPGQKYLKGEGFTLTIPLEPQERLFGIGDEGRTSIARRGTICNINIVNVQAYGPVPYLMSTGGWSILVNCTYPQIYDLGKTDPDRIVLTAENGYVDFYIFLPADGSIAGNLELSTRITGRPLLMPKSFYGFTFVFNEMTDARHMLYECKMFRDDDIPVDTVGLEPQWMEKMYDFSTDKKWDQGRFWFPDWEPANNSGNWTFGWALRNLGFKLSLWLCNNYDLLWEEERQAGCFDKPKEINYSYTDAMIRDGHFANSTFIDEITKRDEAWFTHLEKFVDNGAAGFKMDGCSQVTHHPDRYWACKYHDDEVHNVYPVIYAKQMKEGFQRHTKGRRAVLYTPCVYAGTQQYAASWAGDTGGGFKTLISMLNYGFCGHTNVTCDMDPTPQGIHYGFLLPWVQYLGWNNWQQPWFLPQDLHNMLRDYAKLRSSLFPYIYSMAYRSHLTGLPIARALSMMHADHPEYDTVQNCYYLGDALLVGAFDMHLTLPKGDWFDYFTGQKYSGGRELDYEIPKGRGGALLVKAGSVFCTMEPQKYIEEKVPQTYNLLVYPGGDASFTLYDDDGLTYAYEDGAYTQTQISLTQTTPRACTLHIAQRQGTWQARPRQADEPLSTPDVPGVSPIPGFHVYIHAAPSAQVFCSDGTPIPVERKENGCVFHVPAKQHATGPLCYHITY